MKALSRMTRCARCNRRVTSKEEDAQQGGWFAFPYVEQLIGYVCEGCRGKPDPFTPAELTGAAVIAEGWEHGHELVAEDERTAKAATLLIRMQQIRVKQMERREDGTNPGTHPDDPAL